MKDDDFGPWFDKGPTQVRNAFIEFAKETPWLEQFNGIRPAKRPPTNVEFEVVYDGLSVDPSRRDGERLPCNLCGTRNKFCLTGLLIVDEFGWPYLGGAVCGRKHFGADVFNKQLTEYNRREKEDHALQFLFDAMANVGEWIDVTRAIIPIAGQADKAAADLLKTPTIQRALKQAADKTEGHLIVTQTEFRNLANGRQKAFEKPILVGTISGGNALTPKKPNLKAQLEDALKLLEPAGENEEAFFETMEAEQKSGHIIRMANVYRRAIKIVRTSYSKLLDFQKFFAAENFEIIRAYGTHDLNTSRFGVEIGQTTRRLIPTVQKYPPPRIRVELLLQDIPYLPTTLGGEYAEIA